MTRTLAAKIITPRIVFGCLLLGFFNPAMSQKLQPLSDNEMENVAGREGVLLSMEYYLNAIKTDKPATTGAHDTDYCAGDYMNCRFTWQVANREQGASHSGLSNTAGEWLVYKDGHLSLAITRLSLDGAYLDEAVSAQGATYPTWFRPAKFQDATGSCLLDGGCTVSAFADMPGLKTHYPLTSGSYDSASKISSGYNDVRLGLQVSGLAVEYDNGLTPGWMLNSPGSSSVGSSFAGLAVRDNNSHQAGFAIGGNFYLYGF